MFYKSSLVVGGEVTNASPIPSCLINDKIKSLFLTYIQFQNS